MHIPKANPCQNQLRHGHDRTTDCAKGDFRQMLVSVGGQQWDMLRIDVLPCKTTLNTIHERDCTSACRFSKPGCLNPDLTSFRYPTPIASREERGLEGGLGFRV